MKKLIAMLLVLVMALSLVACGGTRPPTRLPVLRVPMKPRAPSLPATRPTSAATTKKSTKRFSAITPSCWTRPKV